MVIHPSSIIICRVRTEHAVCHNRVAPPVAHSAVVTSEGAVRQSRAATIIIHSVASVFAECTVAYSWITCPVEYPAALVPVERAIG